MANTKLYKFIGRTFYQNVTFAEGQVIDPAEYNLKEGDMKALGGQVRELSDEEVESLEAVNEVRRTLPNQAPIEDTDKVVAKLRGEDAVYEDPRVKGPKETKVGERDAHVTRLPPNDHPTSLPLSVDAQATQSAGQIAGTGRGKTLKVDKPEQLPARDTEEGVVTYQPDVEEETTTSPKKKAK